MTRRLEGRVARLERHSDASATTGAPEAPRKCWRWLTKVMAISTPEPEPGEAFGAWLESTSDHALSALQAWHDIADRLEAEIEAMKAEGATEGAMSAHVAAAVQRRIDERYRPHPMTLRWRDPK